MRWPCIALVAGHTALKLLLVPAYRSTDFEVHRNWLSITASLPLGEWYHDARSPWTLDYPPLFAYFERALALIAPLFDSRMLSRDALEYASPPTVLFQRLSVICADVLLYAGARAALIARHQTSGEPPGEALAFALVVCDAGLLLVDHVHFQYNGMLLGILLLAVAAVNRCAYRRAAVLFACLLQLKHLYLLAAPLFFTQLLRSHCFDSSPTGARGRFLFHRFCELAAIVVLVFGACLAPFASAGALRDIASRLFPFGARGLTHTYWAPNLWALYNAADCAVVVAARALRAAGWGGWVAWAASATLAHTSGRVEPEPHAVLPVVSPATTAVLTLLLNAPIIAAVWARPRAHRFGEALCVVSLAAFLTGWHVHEKAILTPLLCAALSALDGPEELRAFAMLAAPAHYSLLPLLHEPAEYALRLLVVCAYAAAATLGVSLTDARLLSGFTRLDMAYIAGLVVIELCASWLLPALVGTRLPFLPLMLTSVYCAAGVLRASALLASLFFRRHQQLADWKSPSL